uniref:Uncharacterized protein n=1 Tax=Strigamia maritima TaxID=126957 RepID=T1JCK0_STRMM
MKTPGNYFSMRERRTRIRHFKILVYKENLQPPIQKTPTFGINMFCSKLSFLLIGILCFLQIQNGLTLNCYECEGEKDCEGSANDCGPPTKDREPFCLKVDGEYVNSGKKIVKKSCTFAPAHHSTKCEDDTSEGLTDLIHFGSMFKPRIGKL